MKVYLDDEKTHVDPCLHNGHSMGWTVMTDTIVLKSQNDPNSPKKPDDPNSLNPSALLFLAIQMSH
jgi:hypothetical protein